MNAHFGAARSIKPACEKNSPVRGLHVVKECVSVGAEDRPAVAHGAETMGNATNESLGAPTA